LADAQQPSSVGCMTGRGLVPVLVMAVIAIGCGGDASSGPSSTQQSDAAGTTIATPPSTAPTPSGPSSTVVAGDGCAHVIDATIEVEGTTATVSATVRSDDTGWEKYADAWEVRTVQGVVLGERALTHPHDTEQPFTRSLGGVEVPLDVTTVIIAAHDSVFGWCGDTFTLELPPRS
jgi:hypothetical protein